MNQFLDRKDFQLFSLGNTKYVFLTGSQQIFEITNPNMDAYFKMCIGEPVNKLLDDESIGKMTEILGRKQTIPEIQEKQKRLMLILNTTHGCNMACKYCFASTHHDRQNVMPLPIVRKSICKMIERNPQAEQYSIYFFGGEPLLHKQFVEEAVEIAKEEIIVNHRKKVNFLLNTNGTLIDDSISRFLAKEGFTVTVSIDGSESANDINRVFLNGHGSFKRIIEGIDILKKHEVCFNLRATLHPKQKNLVDIFRFFEELRVSYSYAFTIAGGQDNTCETRFSDSDVDCLDNEWAKVMEYFWGKVLKRETIYCSDYLRKIQVLKMRKLRIRGCEAGHGTLFVDEKGTYYTCQNMLSFPETAVGSVNEGLNPDKLVKYRSKNLSQLSVCSECWARYLCGGGCVAERYCSDQSKNEYQQKCKIIQLEWKHFICSYIQINQLINNKFNNQNHLDYGRFEKFRA